MVPTELWCAPPDSVRAVGGGGEPGDAVPEQHDVARATDPLGSTDAGRLSRCLVAPEQGNDRRGGRTAVADVAVHDLVWEEELAGHGVADVLLELPVLVRVLSEGVLKRVVGGNETVAKLVEACEVLTSPAGRLDDGDGRRRTRLVGARHGAVARDAALGPQLNDVSQALECKERRLGQVAPDVVIELGEEPPSMVAGPVTHRENASRAHPKQPRHGRRRPWCAQRAA